MLTGNLNIDFSANNISICKKILGFTLSKKRIKLTEINEVKFIKNAADESYTGIGAFRVYDKIPYLLVIKTKSKNFSIGTGLEFFDIEQIKKELRTRKYL